MKTRISVCLLAPIILVAQSAFSQTSALSLSDYLTQVEKSNQGVQASIKQSEGAELLSKQGDLMFKPALFGTAQRSDDRRKTIVPAFQGTRTEVNSYSLGVSQLTTFGLDTKLYYNLISTQLTGTNPAFVPLPAYFDARPVLELTQSLWRNGFGRESRAKRDVIEAQALATSFNQSYQVKVARSNAELAYWNLALARESVRIQKESLERFEKLLAWNQRRARLHLSDNADVLQNKAAVQSRLTDLKVAQDEEAAAMRAFNTARGMDTDIVSEQLQSIDEKKIQSLIPPKRIEFREDVKAAQQLEKVAISSAQLDEERATPDVQIYATLSLNGRDPSFGSSVAESVTGQYPWNTFGIRFSSSLDIGGVNRARRGNDLEKEGASLLLQRRLFEQEREWNNGVKQFIEAKELLKMTSTTEDIQKEKLNYERSRQQKGRSTTFQVLTFEQDYAFAQLANIRAKAQVLRVLAQLKTFGANE